MTETDKENIIKVCILTGANSGIGLKASFKYAAAGYDLIMACRDEVKGQEAVKKVEEATGAKAKVSFMKLDVASLASIRKFVNEFHATGKPLHLLCNNAGMCSESHSKEPLKTEDGFEVTFGTNHLGAFLLTSLLLEDLKKTAAACGEARIVMTSSSLHDPEVKSMKGPCAHLDFDDLQLLEGSSYLGMLAYKNSKLANVLFAKELSKRLEGTGVTANAFCPGFIPTTELNRHESGKTRFMLRTVLAPMFKWKGVTRTEDQGGEALYFVGNDPSLKGESGCYYVDCKKANSSKESNDVEVAKRLWDVSAKMVNKETEIM